jgi:hypothetical protein
MFMANPPAAESGLKYDAGFGLLLLFFGIFLTLILSLAGAPILIKKPLTPASGVNQFAIFYLMAQLIERLIEPFSEWSPSGSKWFQKLFGKGKWFGDTERIKEIPEEMKGKSEEIEKISNQIKTLESIKAPTELERKDLKGLKNQLDTKKDELDKKKDELDTQKTKRSISMWGLASLMGMVLCYFTVGLFEVVGTPFVNLVPLLGGALNDHTLDAILSGIVIGGGTKPLHDTIGYLTKAGTSGGTSS